MGASSGFGGGFAGEGGRRRRWERGFEGPEGRVMIVLWVGMVAGL